jgi:tetratricopeptide (TPR) repeat protein
MGSLGVFLSSILLISAAQVFAADDVVTRAMKLYEKRHYNEAARMLRADSASFDQGKKGSVNLALGMIYFKDAVLHRELYQAALIASQDYLKRLSGAQGPERSRFVDLYFGEALAESGNSSAGATHLKKFLLSESTDPRYRAIAKVSLGLGYYQNNESSKATELWKGINTSDPEVKAELAAAYSKAGLRDKNPSVMAEGMLSEMKKSGKPLSMRMVKNLIAIYARGPGLTEKGLDLLHRSDLKAVSYREILGKSKVINFYDLSLLNDMATLYGRASLAHLEKADDDPKVKDTAEFYLGQACALFGSIEQSSKVTASFVATSQMSQQVKDRIRVWQGANLYARNRKTEAMSLWDELARKQPEDPDLIAEILLACSRMKAECTRVAEKAEAMAEAGESKKLSSLNIAIGKYYLGRSDPVKTISYLEAGRDKSNKNKIESNDPVMLVSLADVYYRTKKFSEALEIYFEMSKQFPEIRQIQEAIQGVYAMEHKSAGDVKIN